MRQRLEHTSDVSQTHKAFTKTWGSSVMVSSNCVNPILGVQQTRKKEENRKKKKKKRKGNRKKDIIHVGNYFPVRGSN